MKRTTRLSFLVLSAALTVFTLRPGAVQAQSNETAPATPEPAVSSAEDRLARAMKIPSKVEEIAQLSKAGVGDPVILTYIKNSETTYNLNAQDIIKLRDQGVSAEVTAAMIQRGGEVRQAAQETAKESQTPTPEIAAAPTYQTQPVVEQPAPITYVSTPVAVQPASTVSVYYFGTSYRAAPTHYYPSYFSSPGYVTFGSSYCAAPRAYYGGYRGGYYRSSARYCR